MNLGAPIRSLEKLFSKSPGIWENSAAVVAGLLVIASASGPGFYFNLAAVTAICWTVLAAIWIVRLMAASLILFARRRQGAPDDRTVFRWGFSPAVFGVSVLIGLSGLPARAALRLSWPAMDRLALEWARRPNSLQQRSWIGLYPIEEVVTLPCGVRFTVAGTGFLSREGFAYCENGSPPLNDGIYKSIGSGWFRWSQPLMD